MKDLQKSINSYINQHVKVVNSVSQISHAIEDAFTTIASCIDRHNKILIFGNGGSAADCQHFVAELVGRFIKERKALPAIALTTDTSILTAVANDYDYESVFTRQVEALVNGGDVVIGVSTSGNSLNVFNALLLAKENEWCTTIGLLGSDGGMIKAIVDIPIVVQSNTTYCIQECHIMILHMLCKLIDERMF